jgi:tetratricopeptide (TPR) repeat protein
MEIDHTQEKHEKPVVFLAYNSQDRALFEAIGEALKQRELTIWLDKEQIAPGQWSQDVIQKAILKVKSAAIFFGTQGLGPWQTVELRTLFSQCVEKGISIIPVLLPGVTELPEELPFLQGLQQVQFKKRIDEVEALNNLVWGITQGQRVPQPTPKPTWLERKWVQLLGLLVFIGLLVGGGILFKSRYGELKSFEENTFGILVAAFEGGTEQQKEQGKKTQHNLESALNARFRELGISEAEAEARKLPPSLVLKSHQEARTIGEKYHAQLLIWGDVNDTGIIPNLTLIRSVSKDFVPVKAETTLLKDTLSYTALAEMKDLRFPPLTDEPTSLVSFVTGLKYYKKGEYQKALEYVTQALRNSSKYIDSASILFYRGNMYYDMGEYDQAVVDFTQSLTINPKFAEAYFNRGNAYYKKREYDKAIADYTQALTINPKLVETYYNRGNAYSEKGEYKQAIDDYTQALTINPMFVGAYYNRGNAYSEKGEYEQAIDDYTQAIAINPNYADAYGNRGIAYREKGKYDQAIADFTQVLTINPKDAKAHSNRGNVYADKGEYDKAITDFTQALTLNPKDATTYRVQAWLLATCPDGRYRDGTKAVELAQKAVELEPNNAYSMAALAAAYAEVGSFEEAIATQEQAIKLLNTDKSPAEYIEQLKSYQAHQPWRGK